MIWIKTVISFSQVSVWPRRAPDEGVSLSSWRSRATSASRRVLLRWSDWYALGKTWAKKESFRTGFSFFPLWRYDHDLSFGLAKGPLHPRPARRSAPEWCHWEFQAEAHFLLIKRHFFNSIHMVSLLHMVYNSFLPLLCDSSLFSSSYF